MKRHYKFNESIPLSQNEPSRMTNTAKKKELISSLDVQLNCITFENLISDLRKAVQLKRGNYETIHRAV